MQKVQIFENSSQCALQADINRFAKTHHIEQISYAAVTQDYYYCYSCCILYTEKENSKNS